MKKITFLIALSLGLIAPLPAADPGPTLAPVDEQVQRWRQYVDDVHALHKRLIGGRAVSVANRTGGYANQPGYYQEETYTDSGSGRMISRLQWVRQTPTLLHAIEVYVHDRQGRIVRDYSVWYLPDHRNAPWAATVSLHAHPDGLTAFRSFNADDVLVQEACRGRYQGKDIDISFDEFARLEEERKPGGGALGSPLYKRCFGSLPVNSAGRFLKPQ